MSQPSNSPVRASLVWISKHSKSPPSAITTALQNKGYRLQAHETGIKAELALIDIRHEPITGALTRQLLAKARAAAPHGDCLFIAADDLDDTSRAHLRKSGEFVLYKDSTAQIVHRIREKLRNLRFQEEAGERLKTLASCSAMPPLKPVRNKAGGRILFVGAPGHHALTAMSAIQHQGFDVETAMTPSQTVAALNARPYDCAVFAPQKPSDPLKSIAAAMMRKRALHLTPVLFIGDENVSPNHRIISPSHVAKDLGPMIARAITRARQQVMLRQIYKAPPHDGIIDPSTKAYSASFFARHAARLFARADETARPLSFAVIKIGLPSFVSDQAAQHLAPMAQAAKLIMRTCRQEDMVARLAPDAFVLTLPNVTGEDSDRIGERASAVLRTSVLKNPNTDAPTQEKILNFCVNAHTVVKEEATCIEEIVAQLLASATAQNDNDAPLTAYPWG